MSSDRFRRCRQLFDMLYELPADKWRSTLDRECPDDASLREEVWTLLTAKEQNGEELIQRVAQSAVAALLESHRIDPERIVGNTVGRYRVLRMIGQGGMGVVYLAEDEVLGRKAALKAVLPHSATDVRHVERLRQEARVLASLTHPNLATVYGLEQSEDGLYLAMEYLEGNTLAQHLSRETVWVEDSLRWCEQISAGLEAAHEAGIIHRDLKPGNIMFTADGIVKVLDFGLSRQMANPEMSRVTLSDVTVENQLTLTRQGSLFGTPAYMSPEQARGEPLDQRSDIFAFGSILFRCLAGRSAFPGDTDSEVIEAILTRDPDWQLLPREVASDVRRILRRCLAKQPSDRYRHIGDVRLDLRNVIDEMRSHAFNWSGPYRLPGRSSTWRGTVIGGVVCLVLLLGLLLIRPWIVQVDSSASTRRFDLVFPEGVVQSDLERVQVAVSPDGSNIVIACATPSGGQALWIRSHQQPEWRRVEKSDGAHRPFFSNDGQWIGYFRDGHLYKQRQNGLGDPIRLATTTNWYGASWADDDSLIYSPAWGSPLSVAVSGSGTSTVPSVPRTISRLDSNRDEFSHINPTVVGGTRWVLYNTWNGGETCSIRATHLDTGSDHEVIDNATTPRIAATPNGTYLLFERASIIFAVQFDKIHAKVAGGEYAIAEGVLTDATRFVAYYDIASDGTLLYYPGRTFAEENRLTYVNADGTTTPFSDDRLAFCDPLFSSDGSKLGAVVKGKRYRVWLYDLARQTSEYVLSGGEGDALGHAVSPDGSKIVCSINRDGYGIDLISLSEKRLLRRLLPADADYASDLGWTRDGKSITFSTSPREGIPRDIWMFPVEGGPEVKPQPVISSPAEDRQATVSPDGRWIAYCSDRSGRYEVYISAFPQGDRTRQISVHGGNCPAWAPDGRTLYFASPEGLAKVLLDAEGAMVGRPVVIYDKPFGQSDPLARNLAIAPDGRVLIVEPSDQRPAVTHIKVLTKWYDLLPKP